MDLNTDIENYILKNMDQEDLVLQELDRETNRKLAVPRKISGHHQGLLLAMISKMAHPTNILEIGTLTGYSAICLAKGLKEGGKLYTIEIDDELESFSSKYFKKAGFSGRIIQKTGDALKIIPELDVMFDLVFIDADKKEYCRYYEVVFDKVPPGGFIVADNTLWGGKVVQPPAANDLQTRGIIDFNEKIREDQRVEKVIIPFRDGMTIIRKK
jgi:caffeoyl-CoA O-methyltransferase